METSEIVKAKWPHPCGVVVEGSFCLFSDHTETLLIGKGCSEVEAWADAASRIEEEEENWPSEQIWLPGGSNYTTDRRRS